MTLLAIDGPAGAGKTTLAAKLEKEYSAKGSTRVIHLDDLYSGWDDALGADLTKVLSYIVDSHNAGREFLIDKFNWSSMSFDSVENVPYTDVLILEGVGAAQEVVRKAGASTYWLEVLPEIGLERVLKRDGEHLKIEMKKWQIQQEYHFDKDQTRQNCNVNPS